MAGLVPAIYVLDAARPWRLGCPRQARAWQKREQFNPIGG